MTDTTLFPNLPVGVATVQPDPTSLDAYVGVVCSGGQNFSLTGTRPIGSPEEGKAVFNESTEKCMEAAAAVQNRFPTLVGVDAHLFDDQAHSQLHFECADGRELSGHFAPTALAEIQQAADRLRELTHSPDTPENRSATTATTAAGIAVREAGATCAQPPKIPTRFSR